MVAQICVIAVVATFCGCLVAMVNAVIKEREKGSK